MGEVFSCDNCQDECPGTDECNECSATLCSNCAAEYAVGCGLCYAEFEDDKGSDY